MTPRTPALVAALAIGPIAPATGQTCTEPHYRWSEKVDTAFAHQTPTDVDVSDILAWPARTIKSKDKCASRIGRERKVYSVTAWVRRIKTRETDGDWHIEVTEEEDTAVPLLVSSSRSRRRRTAVSTARPATSSPPSSIGPTSAPTAT